MKKKLGLALAFGGLYLATPLLLAQTSAPAKDAASGLAEAKAAQEAAPTSLLDSALFYQLLIGEITLREGEPAASFALLLDAARKTHDAQLYQRATDVA